MKRCIPILIFTLFIFSCSTERTISLWSDRKEMADIVELYNRSGTENRVIFQYKEELVSSFANSEAKPDVIIGGDLANALIKSEMRSLNEMFGKLEITGTLTGGASLDGEMKLIPLSYSPVTVLFTKNSKRIDRSNPDIDLALMRELAASYNEEKKLGYSPFWDDDLLLAAMDLEGASFSGNSESVLTWNSESLEESLSFLLEWSELNGGRESEDLFNGKYMYDNRIKILKEERILFTVFNLGDFMILSDSMSRDLDFLYLSHNEILHPGDITYGGIYRKTDSYEISSQFLSWLLSSETQESVIASAISNRTGTFGFIGGLSSIDDVNRLVMTRYYPELTGKIPEPTYFLPQEEKPVDYSAVKYELLTPWLKERRNGEILTLNEALEKWQKLRIPF